MITRGWCFPFILTYTIISINSNAIQLIPIQLYAIENSSATLTCSKTNGILAESVWINSQITNDANLYYLNGQCISTRFLKDSDLFGGVCNSNGTYSVVLKKIDRNQHGAEWTCREISPSNTVVIQVSVPATSVKLRQANGDYIKESTKTIISCKTSECRPEPRVQWYLRNSTGQVVNNLTQLSTQTYIDGEYGLKAVDSILQFSPNRTANNLRLYCEVRTRTDEVDKLSRQIIVNVTYPPDNSPVINGSVPNNIIQVIESDKGTFVCSISGGNPLASLSWKCFDSHDLTSSTQDGTVTSIVKWTALRGYSTCSCTSHHVLSDWKRTTNVTVNIQYPPHVPTITISNGTRQINVTKATIQLKERDNINMACFSKGNPVPKYTWDSPNDEIQGHMRQFMNISLNDAGNYTCYVRNLMKRTFGDTEHGLNSSSIYLDIMYPSTIASLKDVSIPEGSNLNETCQVQRGNPSYENISWTRQSDSMNWKDNRLTITNVSRADDTNYTCTLQNTIIPTIGDKTSFVTSRTIHLNVLYKAHLLNYLVLNSSAHDSVTVAENETVGLQCEIEGNPTPTCKIYNEHNSDMEHQIKYSNNYATCSINFTASCLHFGVYKCKGANVINTPGYTEKTINIFVECSPRPSPSVPVMDRVIGEINTSITLHFTALSYPQPNSVLWRKLDGKSWNNVNESNNIRIYQSNLYFGMTIVRASKADFGEYKLFISNAVGSYIHNFYIEYSAASSQSDVQRNTGLIIGLTIVVILLVTIVTVFGVIWYRRRRNLKRPDTDVNNSYQNVSGANSQQNSNDNEYEKIGLNVKDSENKVNGSSKCFEDIEENNDIPVTYEKLADDRKDLNQYSQLHSTKEKQDGNETEKNVSSGKDEQHAELSNYINMNI